MLLLLLSSNVDQRLVQRTQPNLGLPTLCDSQSELLLVLLLQLQQLRVWRGLDDLPPADRHPVPKLEQVA